jgi:ABC-type amino acid transport substrate-binding protein
MVRANSPAESFVDMRSQWIGYFESEPEAEDKINALAEEARAIVSTIIIVNEEEAVFGMIEQQNWHAVFGDSLKLVPQVQDNPDEVRLTTGGENEGWYSREYLGFAVPRNDLDFRLLVDYTLQELYRDGTLATLVQPVMLAEDVPVVEVWPGSSEYLGYQLDQVLGG